jgi:hypothetical protein
MTRISTSAVASLISTRGARKASQRPRQLRPATPTSQPSAVLPACVQSLLTRTMEGDAVRSDHNQPVRFP